MVEGKRLQPYDGSDIAYTGQVILSFRYSQSPSASGTCPSALIMLFLNARRSATFRLYLKLVFDRAIKHRRNVISKSNMGRTGLHEWRAFGNRGPAAYSLPSEWLRSRQDHLYEVRNTTNGLRRQKQVGISAFQSTLCLYIVWKVSPRPDCSRINRPMTKSLRQSTSAPSTRGTPVYLAV